MDLIVVADRRWGIGKDGDQQVYIPADLKRFRELTLGHAVVMGHRTLETLPGGRTLKGRRNLILSRTPGLSVPGGEAFSSLNSLLQEAPEDSYVIGGESVYRQLLPWCRRALVTRLELELPADSFFPDLDADPDWEIADHSEVHSYRGLRYCYMTYMRVRGSGSESRNLYAR